MISQPVTPSGAFPFLHVQYSTSSLGFHVAGDSCLELILAFLVPFFLPSAFAIGLTFNKNK